MAYQVLARKWRPQNFQSLVGQDHVLRTLINALDAQRLHHAYLFSGTRGVGKTTIARILARCLNCEVGVSSNPCGTCASCTEITEGRFVDLIEVDAASRTKVEDTRELLENVQYAPTRGRFKVYLIDEVHMLSSSSFNALLKTLEEPPPHVKFILATTDPQKLPITVLSRCLQFSLKNITVEKVANYLRDILTQESIAFDDASLWQLGQAAKGSMRDALSITDQAIGFCGGELNAASLNQMLGTIDQARVVAMLEALQNNDATSLLQSVAHLVEHGQSIVTASEDLLALLHQVAICQIVPDAPIAAQFDMTKVKQLAQEVSPADIQLFYEMGVQAHKSLDKNPNMQHGFEMTLLRMLAFRPQQHAHDMGSISAISNADKTAAPSGPALDSSIITAEPSVPLDPAAIVNVGAEQTVEDVPPWQDTPSLSETADDEVPADIDIANTVDTSTIDKEPDDAESGSLELLQADLNPAQSIEPEPEPETPPTLWNLADLNENTWPKLFDELNLDGPSYAIASKLVFAKRSGTQLTFMLEQSQSSILNAQHQSKIRQALEKLFACDLQLAIDISITSSHSDSVNTSAESPWDYKEREKQQQQQQNRDAITQDPYAQQLEEAFNGNFIDASITGLVPSDEKTES